MKEFLTFWKYQNKAGRLYKWMLLVVLTSFSFVCSYIRVFLMTIMPDCVPRICCCFFKGWLGACTGRWNKYDKRSYIYICR